MSVKTGYLLSKTRRPRILFDMDDVLADFIGEVIRRYNERTNSNHSIDECTKWDLSDTFGKEIDEIMTEQGLYESLETKNDAVQIMKELIESTKYDVFIVTACPAEAYREKLVWLNKFMPFFNQRRIIPCSEKSAIWGDVLIDDKLENLYDYEKIGDCLVYDAPHNRSDSRYQRVFCLKDVKNYLDEKFYNIISA